MNNGIMKTVQVEGTFLSPVHVGWGKELDPFCSFIKEGRLYYFEMAKAVQGLSEEERAEFFRLIQKNNLIEIRKFLNYRLDPEKHARLGISVSQSVSNEYSVKIDDPRNQLIFEPFFRNGHDLNPTIPGSSLKGAIRTAVIDSVVRGKNITLEGSSLANPRVMESRVLGYRSLEEDPFKAIKVADVALGHGSTIIYHVLNYSPHRSSPAGLGLRFEATRSYVDGVQLSFQTVLNVFEGFKGRTIRTKKFTKKAVSMYLEPEDIVVACKKFYLRNIQEEHQRFYVDSPYAEVSGKLIEAAGKLRDDESLIRVGRFTHAESKSISGYRKIMVRGRGGRSRPLDFGTTRNIADGRYPMGWIKLRFRGVDAEKIKMAVVEKQPAGIRVSQKVSRGGRKKISKVTPVDLRELKNKFRVK